MCDVTISIKKTIRARWWCFALLVGIASNCLAIPDTIPPTSITPTLNGLKIAYFMKQNVIKVTLYVVNNEKFSVVCQTQYESGADKKHSLEQQITRGKAISFSFDYAKKTGSINLQLVCVKSDANSTATTPPSTPSPSIDAPPPTEITTAHPTIDEVDISSPH